MHECDQRQAFVTVLDSHVSTRGEAGRIVLTVLGMVAQMERRFIKERQREGIARAKADGVYRGGKRRLDLKETSMNAAGLGPAAIAAALGCSRSVSRPCRKSLDLTEMLIAVPCAMQARLSHGHHEGARAAGLIEAQCFSSLLAERGAHNGGRRFRCSEIRLELNILRGSPR
jgi:hypothetical protein